MKRLNFFPFYEELLRSRTKTTTLRLGDAPYSPGEAVLLSVGWEEHKATVLHGCRITDAYKTTVSGLSAIDLEGESPDCASAAAAQLVLSCIYRTVVTTESEVTVIKFVHN